MTTPLWHPPAPGLGVKRRDAETVQAFVNARPSRPKLVVLGFAGLAGELDGVDVGDARVIVADADPAVRALWSVARTGGLVAARARALRGWTRLVAHAGGDVRQAWGKLRQTEACVVGDDARHAAWALVAFAGAVNGLRRRNKAGQFNAPMGRWELGWVEQRLASAERLAECDAWAKDRIAAVYDDWLVAVNASRRLAAPEDRLYTFDPPYGVEQANVYMQGWGPAQRDRLIVEARALAKHGSRVAAWCGVGDVRAWSGTELIDGREFVDDHGFLWLFRPASTAMKAPRMKKDGTREPTRKAKGGWIGWTH